jgi:hypothetical protein
MKIETNETIVLNKIIILKLTGIKNRLQKIADDSHQDSRLIEKIDDLIKAHENQIERLLTIMLKV